MTGDQLLVITAILSAFAACVGIFFLARQNARENQRQQEARVDTAVRTAVAPLQAQLTAANQTILRQDRAAERSQNRIEELEDELRRMR